MPLVRNDRVPPGLPAGGGTPSAAALIEAILLAAGESRRMGYPKPLLKLGSRTFIEILATAILKSAARLIVVVGAHSEAVRRAVPRDSRITVVENRNYRYGQLSSIKVALPHVGPDAAGAMVHLVDHPMVDASTFAALLGEYRDHGMPIVIARYKGHRGHPVLFSRDLFVELASAPDDQGARSVVQADSSRVAYVDVDDPGVLTDLDTPRDLQRAGLRYPARQP